MATQSTALSRALDNRHVLGFVFLLPARRAAAPVPDVSARPRHVARVHRRQGRPQRRIRRPREFPVPVGRRGHAPRALQHDLLYGRRQHHQVRARACGSRCCSTSTCRSRRSSARSCCCRSSCRRRCPRSRSGGSTTRSSRSSAGCCCGSGIINAYIDFLGEPWNARFATIAANIWRGVPFVAITLLAGLQTISPSLLRGGEPRRRDPSGSSSGT